MSTQNENIENIENPEAIASGTVGPDMSQVETSLDLTNEVREFKVHATQDDIQTIRGLFGNHIQENINAPDVRPEDKTLAICNGLYTASEGLLRVSDLLHHALKNTPDTIIIPKTVSSIGIILAHIALKLANDQEFLNSTEYKISKEDLDPLMAIINSINVDLPEELK